MGSERIPNVLLPTSLWWDDVVARAPTDRLTLSFGWAVASLLLTDGPTDRPTTCGRAGGRAKHTALGRGHTREDCPVYDGLERDWHGRGREGGGGWWVGGKIGCW